MGFKEAKILHLVPFVENNLNHSHVFILICVYVFTLQVVGGD